MLQFALIRSGPLAALCIALLTFAALETVRSTGHPMDVAFAADAPAPTDAPPAEPLEPGLSLTIQALDDAGKPVGLSDTRSVRIIALHVPADGCASSFVKPGRFRATWTGTLNLKLREKFGFLAFGRGAISVTIADKEVLKADSDDLGKTTGEEVRLKKGPNTLTVVYDSPAAGDATVRLYWQQKGIKPEPIPPTSLTHDAKGMDVARGDLVRAGRLAFAEMRCAKCHTTPAAPASGPTSPPLSSKLASTAMPELTMDAPSLKDVAVRLRPDWMAAWIDNPRALRPTSHMPRVFHDGTPDGKQVDPRSADVAAYFASLSPLADAPMPPADAKTVQQGGKLYASLMCLACHSAPDAPADGSADAGRVPHRFVSSKFSSTGLRQYLLNPEAHYAWNPMPNFRLTEVEANALAGYLESFTQPAPAVQVGRGDPAKGKALVLSSGCLNCHSLDGASTLRAPSLADLSPAQWNGGGGCLAEDAHASRQAPHYALTPAERAALLAFGATDRSSLSRDSAQEFSTRQFAAMRCGSCHARDAAQPALTSTLGDETQALYTRFFSADATAGAPEGAWAPDQRAFPILTWVGEKLRPEWTAAFIHGDVTYKPRPYLRARMPAFPVRAAGLAQGLAAEHGFVPTSAVHPPPDAAQVSFGQRLVGQVGGFSCVQCHSVSARPPLAPFEAPALNFSHVSERLRKEYFDRWMWNPIRVDPTTKMPQFGDYEGVTAIKDVLEGDAARQYESIWQYLLQGKDVKPPQ